MQQAAAPWAMKTLPVLRTHLCDPTRLAASSSSFHSTPASFAKWKNKWDCPKSEKGARKASRNYERYVVRQKRAEGKKALKDYLLYGKSSPHLQGSLRQQCVYARMMEAQEALLILMKFHGSRPLGKDLRVTGRKEYTIKERVKRTRRGSATSSMRTIMCTRTKSLKLSLALIVVLLGPIYHGTIFASETDHSDLDGVVVNHREREFQVTAKMKARRIAGKQPALVHMPTGSSLDYHHVVH